MISDRLIDWPGSSILLIDLFVTDAGGREGGGGDAESRTGVSLYKVADQSRTHTHTHSLSPIVNLTNQKIVRILSIFLYKVFNIRDTVTT